MQIISTAAPITQGPIGFASLGTMRIKGGPGRIAPRMYELLAPLAPPLATFHGGYIEALAGTQELARTLSVDRDAAVLAMMRADDAWVVQRVNAHSLVGTAIDSQAGPDCYDAEVLDAADGLFALVTAQSKLQVLYTR
jgi:hypothetical protein